MAGTRLLERRRRRAPAPAPRQPARRRRRAVVLKALAIAAVVAATLAGATLTLSGVQQTKRLSAGSIRLSVSPFHHGALDLYVPLVDWGVRFDAVRLPARLHVDLRSVDRQEV